jgi:hypothetical protein
MLGPGEEVVTIPITIGQPFAIEYTQVGTQKYEAWMEVDLDVTSGYNLTGTVLINENGTPRGQYTLAETGEGSPVSERSASTRTSWVSSNVGGSGSVSGTVSLFPIPAYADGGRVSLTGTVLASPGTTGTIRLFVAKRD